MPINNHDVDYDLVHKYLLGDEESGRILYSKSNLYLGKYIASRLNKSILDEDVLDTIQKTLIKSVEKLDRFKKGVKFTTWLCGIANNVIHELYREKKKYDNLISFEDLEKDIEDEINSYGQNPVNIIIKKELVKCLESSNDELSKDHRDIINLRNFNNAPIKQISELLNESISAIDSRYRRAIQSLKKIIQKNRC